MIIQENIPISSLTTMRIGGNARYVAEVENLQDLKEAYEFARNPKMRPEGAGTKGPLPTWIMGGGANTIGRDEGFPGLIILNRIKGIEILSQTADEVVIRAMGGEVWDDLVAFTTERGYSGIETLSAIPGTVGAAPVQNIGAYGQDISHVIESVDAYDAQTGELVVIGKEDMNMSYRSTIFNTGKDAGRYFITAVTIVLENESSMQPPFYNSLQQYLNEHNITDYSPTSIRNAVIAIRKEKLPDPKIEPSAGSFFKNIYLNYKEAESAESKGIKVYTKSDEQKMINSGYLIEQAGLKGKTLHGFHISDKAALILINKSANSYADLVAARQEIIDTVYTKFGFKLEQEPVEIVAATNTALEK
ncbi:UDP-N-acetylmuramate dehydrogenase [Candidatus Saccharibacteria bacterium]|nr:UDP-N-acetylmuramate dehydrogenase [Candidatus Saccharibacteria bacterium]